MEDLRIALGIYVQNLLQHVLHVDLQNVNKIQPKFWQGMQVTFTKQATLIITNYGTHNKLNAINLVLVSKQRFRVVRRPISDERDEPY